MIDRGAMIDDAAAGHGEPPMDVPGHAPESLEQRVHRLEDAVAALQDTQLMEERITERVMDRVHGREAPAPTAVTAALRRTPEPAPESNPSAPEPTPEPSAAPASVRRSWLIVEVFRELKTMIGMFFDTRYRVSWSALFALMLLAYVLVSQWLWTLWAGIPVLGFVSTVMNIGFVGTILDKAVDLIFALFAYKTLSREMVRYRAAIAGPASNHEQCS
jgi:hypothetical protein